MNIIKKLFFRKYIEKINELKSENKIIKSALKSVKSKEYFVVKNHNLSFIEIKTNEQEARKIAFDCFSDGYHDRLPEMFLTSIGSTCEEISTTGESRILLSDFNAG
jgi:hypothetical protein